MILPTRLATALLVVQLNAITAVAKDTSAETAQRDPRTRPVTSAASPVTSLAIAPTPQLKALPETAPLKNAISAPRLVTLPETAQRPVDTTADTAVTRVATAVVTEVVEARPATLAVAMAIYPEIALKARSATTAAKWAISPVTAHLRLPASELATSASSQVTSRLNAPTKTKFRVMSTRRMSYDENDFTIARSQLYEQKGFRAFPKWIGVV